MARLHPSRWRRAIVAALSAASFLACTLTADLDRHRADPALAAGADGAAAPSDGGAGLDSGVDGGCPSEGMVFFCDDFDRSEQDVRGAWDALDVRGGATIRIAPGDGDKLLDVMAPAGDALATLERSFAGGVRARHFFYEFDVRYDALPTEGSYIVARVAFQTGSEYALSYVYASAETFRYAEQRVPRDYRHEPLAIGAGEWHRVTVEFTIGGDTRVAVDGADAFAVRPTASYFAPGPPELMVGVASAEELAPGFGVQLDRVRFFAE